MCLLDVLTKLFDIVLVLGASNVKRTPGEKKKEFNVKY
jgi:hypothetical protein